MEGEFAVALDHPTEVKGLPLSQLQVGLRSCILDRGKFYNFPSLGEWDGRPWHGVGNWAVKWEGGGRNCWGGRKSGSQGEECLLKPQLVAQLDNKDVIPRLYASPANLC